MSETQQLIFCVGFFGTVLVGMFVIMWIIDSLRVALMGMGILFGVCAAVAGLMLFWYGVAGGFA